ncbi:MAG: hypothetical protein E7392_01140 [Ruminococcaceae bacterium]|nr:hypothetical protein [Oscillospiraceae bacterium]
MKKFMKAIALATVLCLALSTAAFADNADKGDANYTVDVVVDGAASQEVALVIVEGDVANTSDINDGNIVYIDQKTAGASGTTFNAVPIDDEVETVTVFVGYDGAAANRLASFDIGPDVTTIGIVTNSVKVVKAANGIGVALQVDNITAGATKMIWAMTVGTTRRFSNPVNIAGTTGSVYYGARFENVSDLSKDAISDVGAIFLVNGSEVFTHGTDAAFEADND